MAASEVTVPATPTSVGARRRRQRDDRRERVGDLARSGGDLGGGGGSLWTWRSVRRTEPSGRLVRNRTAPRWATMISVEPPPMSTTTERPARPRRRRERRGDGAEGQRRLARAVDHLDGHAQDLARRAPGTSRALGARRSPSVPMAAIVRAVRARDRARIRAAPRASRAMPSAPSSPLAADAAPQARDLGALVQHADAAAERPRAPTSSSVVLVPTSIVATSCAIVTSPLQRRAGAGPQLGDEPLPRQICTSWCVSGFCDEQPAARRDVGQQPAVGRPGRIQVRALALGHAIDLRRASCRG